MAKTTSKKVPTDVPVDGVPNKMLLKGKVNGPKDQIIEIELCDDARNVAGFGQPVTDDYAKKMVREYCKDVLAAQSFIEKIRETHKDDPDFKKLQQLLNSDRHIVSGVFGKEIILQILAQPKCEGIRYMFGKYQNKTTIILKGVAEVKEGATAQGRTIEAKSKPLENPTNLSRIYAQGERTMTSINGEVHKSSKTVTEILSSMEANTQEAANGNGKTKKIKAAAKKNGSGLNMAARANGKPALSASAIADAIFGEY